ncbi:MAG: Glutamine--fructose-6-phosphate aminotransferase [isomerizing] [Phycisphaerae bacterium]|nr:Glutamine--fructose-6-phosphate aminotransferase [isomerizing] [Phycisphaerae bacterium]
MCGIVGYLGKRPAQPILIEGLKRLEYRGYDSAGVALCDGTRLSVVRSVGRIGNLQQRLAARGDDPSSLGIAHTRWATHGEPTEINAHPHTDASGRIALVHNGIVENYASLKEFLVGEGLAFRSQTDTEVLAQLVGYLYDGDLASAVRAALGRVQGTYGIAVISADEPGLLVAARKGSPLLIGVGDGEYIVASDPSAIVPHTDRVIYLDDGEMASITADAVRTVTLDNVPVDKTEARVELSLEQIELDGYEHYMLKEICEQPATLRNCLAGRLDVRDGRIQLGGVAAHLRQLATSGRITLIGCGTAWHAGLVGGYLFESLARMPAAVDYASEFRYRNPIIEPGTVVIAISQSGETADTLAALREARERGALVLGVVNAVGSTIARETDAGVYLHVGPEIGVASTKAFTGQLAVLTMLAMTLGRRRHMSIGMFESLLHGLSKIPDAIARALEQSDLIRGIAARNVERNNWLFLGRGLNYPVALEGALKLKEISYIHAEGMPAAEMKHGPIALISRGTPAVFIATRSEQYEKVISNMEEVRSRGGRLIVIGNEGDKQVSGLADEFIPVPEVPEPLAPMVNVVPLQLLAYHAAVIRGCNVDKPRNLAKSVTVE